MDQHLELLRHRGCEFPSVSDPLQYTSARIWHCKFASLYPIGQFSSLRRLAIAGYPDATFELLASLSHLEELQVVHMPHVCSLAPLAALTSLRKLSLSTLPSWDASGKVTVVDSLAPLAQLQNLESVELFGVL